MESEPRNLISDLYHRALARPMQERSAFLKDACAGDEALRREVESLLSYDDAASGFLERPAGIVSDMVPQVHGTIMLNRQLGPYRIVAPLGSGGMGEVYRARDGKLGRDVAIKILPSHFTSDPERRARFAREARALATLNHPNIAAIYGLEEADGVTGLVLELVEGSTLADRLERGPLPIAEALTVARQIADALDAAHQKGIVHRDLKPANIVLQASSSSSDPRVKVLDFGLAKTAAAAEPGLGAETHVSATADGRILGTPAYMSPEQARGEPVDKRTDIWAFGCVLFEMLSGHRAFEGRTVTDILARVVEHDPDWTKLPTSIPAPILTLLQRCLRKDHHKRLHDIGDAGIELDEVDRLDSGLVDALSGSEIDAPVALSISRMRGRLTWASSLLLVGLTAAAIVAWAIRPVPVPLETTRTILSVAPTGETSGANPLEQRVGAPRPTRTAVALSPDGKTLVFGAIWGAPQQLYARAMDQLTAIPISGTSRGHSPFFSPDGQWVGFGADGELRKVPLSGGPAVTLCKASALFGASWGDDGTIVFAEQRNGGLRRVSAEGGLPNRSRRLSQASTVTDCPTCWLAATL